MNALNDENCFTSGNAELLRLACSKYTFPTNGILIDKKQGQTPLHIVARSSYSENSKEIFQILSKHISSNTQDKDGNTADQVMLKTGKKSLFYIDEQFYISLKAHINRLQSKEPLYFIATKEQPEEYFCSASIDYHDDKKNDMPVNDANKRHLKQVDTPKNEATQVPKNEAQVLVAENNDLQKLSFDGLPWEVECTESVLKFIKSDNSRHLRYKIIQQIRRIASGEFHKKLCKEVGSSLKLYEAKITKAARLLWEVAIQFSPRCTGQAGAGHIFSEVIRIWSVVLDHDDINHAIKMIEKSHVGGQNAALKIALYSSKQDGPKTHNRGRVPRTFTLRSNMVQEVVNFVPAASLKSDEYNVVTFYSLSSSALRCIFTSDNVRRDFPFKAWHEEHDIINRPYREEAIILLGRSGTGKTTCCLYRLWNEFNTYWTRISPQQALPVCSSDSENTLCNITHDNSTESKEGFNDGAATADQVGSHDSSSTPQQDCTPSEHLHQVFVTKNPILCTQMKRRFYDLAAGSECCKLHLPFENRGAPTCLRNVEDVAYPLFQTARQFYILLDNSLSEKSETFFPRSADGTLSVKISSSDYDQENLDTVLDLGESGSDDEDDGDVNCEHDDAPTAKGRQQSTNVEITALYFVKHIWKEISRKSKHPHTEILDPLLVWMEIKSIIKGSLQAVQSGNGYLTLEEYVAAGKKMAPNFTGSREAVYELFQHYQSYIKQQRYNHLFDECDLIHDLHRRLSAMGDLGWSIHHFYIDEVQDFTQAELALFVRTSRDPNGLFLTGDSAQSIMRGIAFRFSDVRTVLHAAQVFAKEKKDAVQVRIPEVSQLRVNFRSHTGVLNLASSIIDLLKEYFPLSFDYLPGDEGMFTGPTPVLFDTCDACDLALLLRGNKRDKSAIEFGAHQVIIVQSEDAKSQIPEELKDGIILTVFESKGLEFDDVLLYNFFHDSIVSIKYKLVSIITTCIFFYYRSVKNGESSVSTWNTTVI